MEGGPEGGRRKFLLPPFSVYGIKEPTSKWLWKSKSAGPTFHHQSSPTKLNKMPRVCIELNRN